METWEPLKPPENPCACGFSAKSFGSLAAGPGSKRKPRIALGMLFAILWKAFFL
jgi:hypothetical protein